MTEKKMELNYSRNDNDVKVFSLIENGITNKKFKNIKITARNLSECLLYAKSQKCELIIDHGMMSNLVYLLDEASGYSKLN